MACRRHFHLVTAVLLLEGVCCTQEGNAESGYILVCPETLEKRLRSQGREGANPNE